jgi:hypothetical protein
MALFSGPADLLLLYYFFTTSSLLLYYCFPAAAGLALRLAPQRFLRQELS